MHVHYSKKGIWNYKFRRTWLGFITIGNDVYFKSFQFLGFEGFLYLNAKFYSKNTELGIIINLYLNWNRVSKSVKHKMNLIELVHISKYPLKALAVHDNPTYIHTDFIAWKIWLAQQGASCISLPNRYVSSETPHRRKCMLPLNIDIDK